MASFVYTEKTLNGNWYEDRAQPPGSLSVTSGINRKTTRAYESDIAYIGERYDVLGRTARVPQKESYATPDDGFRITEQTSRVDFLDPRSRKLVKAPPKARLITAETIPEVCSENRRPIPGEKLGFGAVVNRHPESEGQRSWSTTHEETFGQHNRARRCRSEPSLVKVGGMGSAMAEARQGCEGVKIGILCGENFKECADPSSDTRTQRTWLYQSDPSLRHIHLGGTKQKNTNADNELSLPLGNGAMSKIRQDLEDRKGRLTRIATEITTGRLGAPRSGISIFQDSREQHFRDITA